MEKAYIILAHKAPEQLSFLVDSLDDGFSTFFIHIDKKANIDQFDILKRYKEKIIFTKRVSAKWGSFGLVEATLLAMQSVVDYNKQFKFVHLLSGQDFPIKSNRYINKFLSETDYNVFIEMFPMPNYDRWIGDGGMYRINKYNFGREVYKVYLAKVLNFLSSSFRLFERKMPYNMKPYGGSQWWSMDLYTLKTILEFIDKNPVYVSFYKYSFTPDEMFFQTILANIDGIKICSDNLRFIKWENYSDAHPLLITPEHVSEFSKSKSLFTRKIDFDKNFDVIPLIETMKINY